jgi:hypothetical protein
MNLYKSLLKVAAGTFPGLNMDEIIERYGDPSAASLGMLATLPMYSALGSITSPLTRFLPLMHPLAGAGEMGLISLLENKLTRNKKRQALRNYGMQMAKNPFSMTINELNNLRGGQA